MKITVTEQKTNQGGLKKWIGDVNGLVSGKSGQLRPAMLGLQAQVAAFHSDVFTSKGTHQVGGRWQQISPATVMLRAKGQFEGKIETNADAVRAAKRANPLRDTNQLFASMVYTEDQSKTRVGVRKVKGLTLWYGTKHPAADTHRKGRTTRRPWNRDLEKRFNAKVSVTRSKGVKGPNARRNWNPFYFKMKNWLKKSQSFKVPKREFLIKRFSRQQTRILDRVIQRVLDKESRKIK